jgi:hypothetical protein
MNFIRGTRQRWKLAVPLIATVLGGAAIECQFPLARLLGTEAFYIALSSFGIAAPAFVLLVLWVRCPSCRLPLVWHAVSKRDHREWFTWLMIVDRCPNSGYNPSIADDRHTVFGAAHRDR